ncbi:MAG: sugar ABC transporter permease [Planctomycetota bacterium]
MQTGDAPDRLHRSHARRLRRALPFIAPWLVGFVTLTAYPFAASLYWSFCRYDLLTPPRWAGGANYRRLADELWSGGPFGRALWNTGYYAAISVPASIALGVLLATLLSQKVRGVAIYRTLWFLPTIVPTVAAAVLWVGMLDPQHGLVNAVLTRAAGEGAAQGWFASTSEAAWPPSWPDQSQSPGRVFGSKDALVLMSLWGVGNFMLIYLAAIADIPTTLYEAARLDGAGPVRRFWHVTLPVLSPVIFFNLVMGTVQAAQAFTQVYLVSDGVGDPAGSTLLLSLHLFLAAFRDLEMGYASAMAWVLFVLVLAITAWLFRTSRGWVHYTHQA